MLIKFSRKKQKKYIEIRYFYIKLTLWKETKQYF